MTYALNATQVESLMLILQALNDASKSIDTILEDKPEGREIGDGHLLMLESPIRVVSDAVGFAEPEVFGWLVDDENGWNFTQTEPKK